MRIRKKYRRALLSHVSRINSTQVSEIVHSGCLQTAWSAVYLHYRMACDNQHLWFWEWFGSWNKMKSCISSHHSCLLILYPPQDCHIPLNLAQLLSVEQQSWSLVIGLIVFPETIQKLTFNLDLRIFLQISDFICLLDACNSWTTSCKLNRDVNFKNKFPIYLLILNRSPE